VDKRDILFIAPVLVTFCVLGVVYSGAVPVWEAPDEPSHFSTIEYIASNGRVPPPDAPVLHRGVAVNATGEPPLYFLAITPLWLPWSKGHVAVVPNERFGRTPEQNHFLQEGEEVEEQGGFPAGLRLLRMASVLMGAATVLLVFLVAKTVWPGEYRRPVATAVLAGLTPQFLFMSSAIGNDALANLLGAALLLRLLKLQTDPAPLPPRASLTTAGLLAAGILTKLSLIALLPAAVIALALRKKRQPKARFGPEVLALVVPLGVVGVWVLLLSPAWTVQWARTLWTGLVGSAQPAAGLHGLWSLLVTTKNTFWGCFGWVDVPLQPHLIDLLDLLTLWAVVGVVLMLIVRRKRPGVHERWHLLMLAVALGVYLVAYVKMNLGAQQSVQGRHLFPALAASATLMVAGIWRAGGARIAGALPWFLLALMIAVNVVGIGLSLVPAYEYRVPPQLVIDASQSTGSHHIRLGAEAPRVGQTFRCDRQNLTRIDLFLTPAGRRRSADLVLHLRRSGQSDVDLRIARVLGPTWSTGGYIDFTFVPVPHSQNETFYFYVEADLASGRPPPCRWEENRRRVICGSPLTASRDPPALRAPIPARRSCSPRTVETSIGKLPATLACTSRVATPCL
jgi:hypothetical protein